MEENPVRVLLDTNILISAILYEGKPGQVLELSTDKQIIVVTSKILLLELQETLMKKFNFPEDRIRQIEQKIVKVSLVVYPKLHIDILKDNDDNRVLEAAIEGECQYIVTGDKELLKLGSYKSIKIVTAEKFLNSI